MLKEWQQKKMNEYKLKEEEKKIYMIAPTTHACTAPCAYFYAIKLCVL